MINHELPKDRKVDIEIQNNVYEYYYNNVADKDTRYVLRMLIYINEQDPKKGVLCDVYVVTETMLGKKSFKYFSGWWRLPCGSDPDNIKKECELHKQGKCKTRLLCTKSLEHILDNMNVCAIYALASGLKISPYASEHLKHGGAFTPELNPFIGAP